MTIVGENNTDIMLDPNGQPVADSSGDFKTVSGDACWEQDLRLEALTEPGELFYEDENGDEAYGFGLLDFSHAENDEFTQKDKLSKRTYLDQRKTRQKISFENGVFRDYVAVSKQDAVDEYNVELTTEEVEVVSE